MSDLVKPWLDPYLLQELENVLQWREEGAGRVQLPGGNVGDSSYQDNGRTLTIKPSRTRQLVQIHKFNRCDIPVDAVLSDSSTRIDADFSDLAMAEYRRRHGQNFTTGSLGGVLQLQDYDILVAVFAGQKRNKQLRILVRDFQLLGAGGAQTFGLAMPRAVESVGQAPTLLARLKDQKKRQLDVRSREPSTGQSSPLSSTLQSPAANATLTNGSYTQNASSALLTQAPFAYNSALPSRLDPKARLNGHRPSALVEKSANMNSNRLISDETKSLSNAALFSEIESPDRSSQHQPTLENDDRKGPSLVTEAVFSDHENENEIPQSAQLSPKSSLSFSNRDSSVSARIPDASSAGSTPKASVNNENTTREIFSSHSQIGRAAQQNSKAGPPPEVRSAGSNFTQSRKCKRSKKISIRDIKMSKEQEALLNGSESWMPPNPGHREPVANIPINVLQTFNAKADALDSRRRRSQHLPDSRPESPSPTFNPPTSEVHDDSDSQSTISVDTPEEFDATETPSQNGGPINASQEASNSPGSSIHISPLRTTSEGAMGPPNAYSDKVNEQASPTHGSPKVGAPVSPRDTTILEIQKHHEDNTVDLSISSYEPVTSTDDPLSWEIKVHQSEEGTNDKRQEVERSLQVSNMTKEGDEEVWPSPHSSDSDELETSVLLALHENVREGHLSTENPPSTAPLPMTSYTQVKRTPYVIGQVQDLKPVMSSNAVSSLESNVTHVSGSSPQEPDNSRIQGTTQQEVLATWDGSSHHELEQNVINKGFDTKEQLGPTFDSSTTAQEELKRKDSFSAEPLPRKRIKVVDFFPESLTQVEEDAERPVDFANKFRRDWFERRRSSASSAVASNPITPTKLPNLHHAAFTLPEMVKQDQQAILEPTSPVNAIVEDEIMCEPSAGSQQALSKNDATPIQAAIPTSVSPNVESTEDVREAAIVRTPDDDMQVPSIATKPSQSPRSAQMDLNDTDTNSQAVAEQVSRRSRSTESGEDTRPTYTASIEQATPEVASDKPKTDVRRKTEVNSEAIDEATLLHRSPPVGLRDFGKRHVTKMPAKRQSNLGNSLERATSTDSGRNSTRSLFDRFKGAYPEYLGDSKHFQASCLKISRISEEGGILPQYVWDDFIIRHKLEYSHYIQQCADTFENPMPYERYYSTMVDTPSFSNKIVNARNLKDGIIASSTSSEACEETVRAESPEIEVSPSFERPFTEGIAKITTPLNQTPMQTSSPVTIDLTLDDDDPMPYQEHHSTPSRTASAQKSRRDLPWNKETDLSGSSVQSSPSRVDQRRRNPFSNASPRVTHTRSSKPSRNRVSLVSAESTSTLRANSPLRREFSETSDLPAPPRKSRTTTSSREREKTKELSEGSREDAEWWRDDQTPFKDFVRNFNAIQPGNGNSYANPAASGQGPVTQTSSLPSRAKKQHIPAWVSNRRYLLAAYAWDRDRYNFAFHTNLTCDRQ
ncbi:uncharacterized protein KY384_001966 [Bacidia gigantensis]|uniref:uncharacterized protein n=1 Tax=Bacidia gigantensis TaxID=2732470 RepID=UPI001D03905F|nr:uncharacterized protein KY384_001966 [Bacidia gigantensis]KAG8533183.1 hypothetical protein KY384_001966 [Bacidia gigantensis]